jgi:hypothetical protein
MLTFLLPSMAFSQKKCTKYVIKKCEAFGFDFTYSGQSKSALFELGQKSDFKLAVFKGFEYRVSLCADKNLKGIFFRIRENNAAKTIIYDSSTEAVDYLEKVFHSEKSRNLIVEVIVPESVVPVEEQDYDDRFGCVGVLIEYNRRLDSGFDN